MSKRDHHLQLAQAFYDQSTGTSSPDVKVVLLLDAIYHSLMALNSDRGVTLTMEEDEPN